MRTRLRLDRQRTALLLIDLQEEQRHDPLYRVEGFDQVLANARALLQASRRIGLLAVHAAYRRDFDACPPRPFEPLSGDGKPAFSDVANPLTAICEEVRPDERETVIYKNDASAFSEASLREHLSRRRIEWVVIAGVWTEACVAASVRDAIAAGLRVLLVKDACGSGTKAMHRTAVLNLANRLYGGAVADTRRALALFEGEERDVWMPERPVPILWRLEDVGARYDAL
jgi:nicotinamidase-related amidase